MLWRVGTAFPKARAFLILFTMEEVWKAVKGYEDYQVSNLGRVKSLKSNKETIIKLRNNCRGYLRVALSKNNKPKEHRVHQLVAMMFLGHIPNGMKNVVNHKDFIKTNNCVDNLEIVTQRKNADHKEKTHSSKYTGVSWNKKLNKWQVFAYINRKQYYLGLYESEEKASEIYEDKIASL